MTPLRAVEIAAAGSHGLLVVGPQGAPKTQLARLLLAALPPISAAELAAFATIYTRTPQTTRPLRAPHHTASEPGLVGAGGARCIPGETSLAHAGVLYLENAPEFRRGSLEAIARTVRAGEAFLPIDAHCRSFPARPIVVASSDPCPCGQAPRRCACTDDRSRAYLTRVAPLLPVLDVSIGVALRDLVPSEVPPDVQQRVVRARKFRLRRGAGETEREPFSQIVLGIALDGAVFARARSREALERVLRVGRTIADLDGSSVIQERHVTEALQLTSGIEALS